MIAHSYYRVKGIDKDEKTASTNIIKVLPGKTSQGIYVVSNRITDAGIKIQFTNMPAGNYLLKLFTNLGQKVLAKNIHYEGGTGIELVSIDIKLSSGIYQMEVNAPGKAVIANTMIR